MHRTAIKLDYKLCGVFFAGAELMAGINPIDGRELPAGNARRDHVPPLRPGGE